MVRTQLPSSNTAPTANFFNGTACSRKHEMRSTSSQCARFHPTIVPPLPPPPPSPRPLNWLHQPSVSLLFPFCQEKHMISLHGGNTRRSLLIHSCDQSCEAVPGQTLTKKYLSETRRTRSTLEHICPAYLSMMFLFLQYFKCRKSKSDTQASS